MILEQGFTDEFIEQFSSQGFYASPNRTKINIFLDGQQWLVGNAIVANIEQTNEKIPVYSYNSPTYSKYLNGREIVTGVIGLRKITVAEFIKMIAVNKENEEAVKEITQLQEELKELEKIVDKNGKKIEATGIKTMIISKQATIKRYKEIIQKNSNKETIQYQMEKYLTGNKWRWCCPAPSSRWCRSPGPTRWPGRPRCGCARSWTPLSCPRPGRLHGPRAPASRSRVPPCPTGAPSPSTM